MLQNFILPVAQHCSFLESRGAKHHEVASQFDYLKEIHWGIWGRKILECLPCRYLHASPWWLSQFSLKLNKLVHAEAWLGSVSTHWGEGMGRKALSSYYGSLISHGIEERARLLKPIALVYILTLPFSRHMDFRQVTEFLCPLTSSFAKR